MKNELIELRDRLLIDRQQLTERLNEVDHKLASIETVFDLLKAEQSQANKSQIPLLKIDQTSDRFVSLPFKIAVNLLLKDNPLKQWAPKDVVPALLKEGFETKSKNFKHTTRIMLGHMRRREEVNYRKAGQGYLYSYKELGSVPHMDATEPNDETGELGE